MRKNIQLVSYLFFAFSLMLFNSCSEDIGTGFAVAPSIVLNSGADLVTGNTTLASGESLKVQISATAGDNDMQFIEFRQDGVRISDINRIKIDGVTASSAAPLLSGTEVSALTWDVEIATDNQQESTYTFLVSDANGNTDFVSLDISINAASPSISFVGIGSTVETSPGAADKKLVTVESNGVNLSALAIYENGNLITDLTRIYYGDLNTNFTNNPMTIEGNDIFGFVKDVFVRQFTMGISEYTIEVQNIAGKTASASYFINAGSSIDAEFTATLLSNADGGNLGGLDLYTGANVSVNSASATIVDQGINGNPNATNWIQKFRHNGVGSIKELSQAQIDAGFSYANIQFKEDILAAWNDAIAPADDQQPTNKVQVGDVYLILNDNDYFIIECTEVVITTNDNLDYYNFNIKQAIY